MRPLSGADRFWSHRFGISHASANPMCGSARSAGSQAVAAPPPAASSADPPPGLNDITQPHPQPCETRRIWGRGGERLSHGRSLRRSLPEGQSSGWAAARVLGVSVGRPRWRKGGSRGSTNVGLSVGPTVVQGAAGRTVSRTAAQKVGQMARAGPSQPRKAPPPPSFSDVSSGWLGRQCRSASLQHKLQPHPVTRKAGLSTTTASISSTASSTTMSSTTSSTTSTTEPFCYDLQASGGVSGGRANPPMDPISTQFGQYLTANFDRDQVARNRPSSGRHRLEMFRFQPNLGARGVSHIFPSMRGWRRGLVAVACSRMPARHRAPQRPSRDVTRTGPAGLAIVAGSRRAWEGHAACAWAPCPLPV